MGNYVVSKMLAGVLSILMVLTVLGYGFLFLLGTSIGRALNSTVDTTGSVRIHLTFLMVLLGVAVITGAGCFGLTRTGWRIFYIGFCFIIGLVFLAAFFYSFGDLGTGFELLLLLISFIYFLQGFCVRKGM